MSSYTLRIFPYFITVTIKEKGPPILVVNKIGDKKGEFQRVLAGTVDLLSLRKFTEEVKAACEERLKKILESDESEGSRIL